MSILSRYLNSNKVYFSSHLGVQDSYTLYPYMSIQMQELVYRHIKIHTQGSMLMEVWLFKPLSSHKCGQRGNPLDTTVLYVTPKTFNKLSLNQNRDQSFQNFNIFLLLQISGSQPPERVPVPRLIDLFTGTCNILTTLKFTRFIKNCRSNFIFNT